MVGDSLMMKCAVALVVLGLSLTVNAVGEPQYQFVEEWSLWKNEHSKAYQSDREELERHLVWLSNKEYIDQHNANADLFGFTLAMNHFGDMVSEKNELSLLFYSPLSLLLFGAD